MTRPPAPVEDGRRLRGHRSRRKLLDRAAATASRWGLDGLSIAQLGDDVGMSKSGVAALFGSKVALQLAVVGRAREMFVDEVVAPVWSLPPGLTRLDGLIRSWLSYVRRDVFPGGCFLQHCLAEQGNRPGPVRDALAAARTEWLDLLGAEVQQAQRGGELAGSDPEQVAFELEALLAAGNRGHVLGDSAALDRAAAAAAARLAAPPDPSATMH